MYERHDQPPVSQKMFLLRVARHVGFAVIVILASLGIGMIGYMTLEALAFEDAFLHAAVLLGGMGLVAPPASTTGKLFAGLYALYSGLVFLAVFGIILAPIIHRLLHKFHWDSTEADQD